MMSNRDTEGSERISINKHKMTLIRVVVSCGADASMTVAVILYLKRRCFSVGAY